MSRSYRNSDNQGKEYWKSRLHRHGEPTGSYTKKLTAKKERKHNKKQANENYRED